MRDFSIERKTLGISSSSTLWQDLEALYKSCDEANLESCDYLIGKENVELKREVKWLRERLANLMGKGKNDEEQVDVSQDMKSQV
jgi:hypothetical protein